MWFGQTLFACINTSNFRTENDSESQHISIFHRSIDGRRSINRSFPILGPPLIWQKKMDTQRHWRDATSTLKSDKTATIAAMPNLFTKIVCVFVVVVVEKGKVYPLMDLFVHCKLTAVADLECQSGPEVVGLP